MNMRKELDYFRIGSSYGGCQDWFYDYMMKGGGCGAVTACDVSIYFDMYKGTKGLYPFALDRLTREDYIRFSNIMKPYLSPRWTGIDRLDIYIDGYGRYLKDRENTSVSMIGFEGDRSEAEALSVIKSRIDKGFPIPILTLHHSNINMEFYEWHWYILSGYESFEDVFMVKAVTYGAWRWLDLHTLWNTGYERRGGLILFDMEEEKK